MRHTSGKWCLLVLLALATSLVFPAPAGADGGWLSGPSEWSQMKEEVQTAVLTIGTDNTVKVDLFVSLLDTDGQPHEVVFFLPLGAGATGFGVKEELSADFNALTRQLDQILKDKDSRKGETRWSLFFSTFAINGAWLLPIWNVVMLSSCSSPTTPEATFQTASSKTSVYNIDENTDLESLIDAAGLHPSVLEVLSRLRGQKVAFITLKTQPPPKPDPKAKEAAIGQPGVHLSWTGPLTSHSLESSYVYSLGTGSAWAHPIALTSVYVVAPPGMDLTVEYPRWFENVKGYYWDAPRIMSHRNRPGYAVDEAAGSFGRVWRVIYTRSNHDEDLVVITRPSGLVGLAQQRMSGWPWLPAAAIGFTLALLLWFVFWRYLAPLVLLRRYSWLDRRFWRDSFPYPAINVALLLGVLAVFGLFNLLVSWHFMGKGVVDEFFVPAILLIAGAVFVVVVVPLAFGVPGVVYIFKTHARSLGVSDERAIAAYSVVSLASNACYLALALGYGYLAGIL